MKYLDLVKLVDALNEKYNGTNSFMMLSELVNDFPDLALVSSFGAESAVLLHLISQVSTEIPVIFIDTGKLFKQTLDYKTTLEKEFGLNNIQIFKPKQELLKENDLNGDLNKKEPNLCCFTRKVEPLSRALINSSIWISGRKKFQSSSRSTLALFELEDMRLKVNPLANWSQADVYAYFKEHQLPAHPLVKEGYLSIGCAPCTTAVKPGEDKRSGRWRGQVKSECGIHGNHENNIQLV